MPSRLKIATAANRRSGSGDRIQRVGVAEGAIGGADRLVALAALFPNVSFEPIGSGWFDGKPDHLDVLIVSAEASRLDEIIQRLADQRSSKWIVVALRDADVVSTRRLIREGAADVLPAPVSEPALALSLERLLNQGAMVGGERRRTGEIVAVLKAGGGVGATSLAVQACAALASRTEDKICLADMDLQFGVAGLYLDLPEAVTIADLLATGAALRETPFSTALTTHRSGLKILAGPRELMPLETLAPSHIDGLFDGLRRDFALTVVDLPSVWTAWTNRLLTLADRIVLVTHLSVPHVQRAKRQIQVLATQKLDSLPLVLVCNSVSPEHQASLSIKTAEKALGRPFDVVIPEDERVMTAAINQGLELSAVRHGTKLEKAVLQLADRISTNATAPAPTRSLW